MVTIVTGPVGSGKTGLVLGLWKDAGGAASAGWAGFVSVRSQGVPQQAGYEAFCLRRERSVPLLRPRDAGALPAAADGGVGRYEVAAGAFEALAGWGEESLRGGCSTLVIDEIGHLELSGAGWAPFLRSALSRAEPPSLLLVVRQSCREAVEKAFGLRRRRLLDLSALSDALVDLVRSQGAAGPRDAGRLAGGGEHAGAALAAPLVRGGKLQERRGAYHPAGVEPERNLSPLGRRLLALATEAGEVGLDPRDGVGPAGSGEAARLVRMGLAVSLGRRLFSAESAAALARRLCSALSGRGEIEIAEIRPHADLARPELLELLDLMEAAHGVRENGRKRAFLEAPSADALAIAAVRRQDGGGSPGDRPRRTEHR